MAGWVSSAVLCGSLWKGMRCGQVRPHGRRQVAGCFRCSFDVSGVEGRVIAVVACAPCAVVDRVNAIDVLHDHPPDTVDGAVNDVVQIGANVPDHGDGRIHQIDLDAAILIDPAARSVFVADTNGNPLNAIAVARQDKTKPPTHVLCQRLGYFKPLTMDVDNHCVPLNPP